MKLTRFGIQVEVGMGQKTIRHLHSTGRLEYEVTKRAVSCTMHSIEGSGYMKVRLRSQVAIVAHLSMFEQAMDFVFFNDYGETVVHCLRILTM